MDSSPWGECFCQRSIHREAPAQQGICDTCAVFVGVARLPKKAEIAVGEGTKLIIWRRGDSSVSFCDSSLSGGSPPWLDHMPDKVNTAIYRLKDRLARVELGAQPW